MRYSDNGVETLVPGVFGIVNGIDPGGSAAGFGGPSLADAWGLHANYLEIIRPTLLFEVKAGKLYFNTDSLPETFGQNVATDYGLQGINIDARTSGLPNFAVAGYTTLGDPRFVPIFLKNDSWQAQATLTNVRGAHNLKAGVAVVRRTMSPIQSNDGTGLYTFTAAPTNNGAGGGGDAAAAFLLGYPFTVARAHLVVDTALNTWEPSLFLQDDWRATDWLTFNLGVRYDIFTPFTEEDGEISNLDINTLQFLIPGENGAGDTAGVETDYGNIAPRIGFAATVREGTVVRGGYGLSFFPSSMASNAVLRNTPFTFTYAATSAAGFRRRAQRVLLHAAADAGPGHAGGRRHHRGRGHRPQVELPASVQRDGGAATLGRLGDGGLRRLEGAADVDGDPEPQLRAGRSRRHQSTALLRGGGPEPDHAAACSAAPASRTTTRCSWRSRAARGAG